MMMVITKFVFTRKANKGLNVTFFLMRQHFNYLVGFATKLGGFWQKVKGQIAFF